MFCPVAASQVKRSSLPSPVKSTVVSLQAVPVDHYEVNGDLKTGQPD
ncbi:MAG: hypothetical protein KKC76_11615 [Proteobacteria bacterium]|nr:hypothetical protein [Pseudomonadota bacterium]MBU4296051.1 hypothetical protein [Pseudomonadota bacterium]MCG2747303.1 hypothetical protein [Desulfobulbaceae bacterium]